MNNMLKYTKMLLLFVLVLGLTSCDSEEETEYNLPGEWYTSEEIDFGAYTWGRGTIMTFNARNQGTIGSYGDPNYLLFRWNWVSGAYNLMELEFYDGGSMAYIEGAMADSYSFSGTWYNSWRVSLEPFYKISQDIKYHVISYLSLSFINLNIS